MKDLGLEDGDEEAGIMNLLITSLVFGEKLRLVAGEVYSIGILGRVSTSFHYNNKWMSD